MRKASSQVKGESPDSTPSSPILSRRSGRRAFLGRTLTSRRHRLSLTSRRHRLSRSGGGGTTSTRLLQSVDTDTGEILDLVQQLDEFLHQITSQFWLWATSPVALIGSDMSSAVVVL